MGNDRRNWHRRWTVDLAARTAEHNTGLTVHFVAGLVLPRPSTGTHCMADGVGEWTGELLGGDDAVPCVPCSADREWTGELLGGDDALITWMSCTGIRDPASVKSRLARLMKEAGRVWARAKADEAQKNES